MTSFQVSAQSEKKLIKDATKYLEDHKFNKALPLYLKLVENYPKQSEYYFNTGLCYLYSAIEKYKAIPYFERVLKDSTLFEKYIITHYYLGQAYHSANRFDDAIKLFESFKKYIHSEETNGLKLLEEVNRRIEMCYNGKQLVFNPTDVVMANLGNIINSPYPDYTPVISADESILVFTSKRPGNVGGKTDENGEYFEDIYISKNINGRWVKPMHIDSTIFLLQHNISDTPSFTPAKRFDPPINTKYHDAAIGLSPNGQKLFIYRKGDIYSTSLVGNAWTKPEKMSTEVINLKKSRQPSISISSDEKTVYFSSDRSGGFGGLDIYKSEKMSNGEWGAAQNIGPVVNTKYDDDALFIHPDGKTLFFSSKGHNSMGGFDIFRTVYSDGAWSEPTNIGYPINTAEDDIFYVESTKGNHAYFASIRDNGYGGMDIYLLLFPGVSIPITEIKGKVLAGNTLKPIPASIDVTDIESGKKITYSNNLLTGEYQILLPPDKKYIFTINAIGYQPHIENIFIPDQKTFYKLYQAINFTLVTVKDKDIGQKVSIQNVFFDIDKAIHSDTLLSKELNKALDSIADVKDMQYKSDNADIIRFKPDESLVNKEDLYFKFINKMPKVTSDESNRSQTQTFAGNTIDTNQFKQINKVKYFIKPDSIAKILDVSEENAEKIISKPIDQALNIMNLPPKSINQILELPPEVAHFVSTLPSDSAVNLLSSDAAINKLSKEIFANKPPELIAGTVVNKSENVNKTTAVKTDNIDTTSSKIETTTVTTTITAPIETIKIATAELKNPIANIKGFFYTVQVGVYRKPVNLAKIFQLSSIYDEIMKNGNYRYISGIYNSLQEAKNAKDEMVNKGIEDAFVVVYYEGNQISMTEAKILMASNNNIQATTTTLTTTTQKEQKNINITANINNTENKGIVFRVQIELYKNYVTAADIKKLNDITADYNMKISVNTNNLSVYTSEDFKDFNSADNLKSVFINKGVNDPFIVAYNNGEEISIDDAQDILTGNLQNKSNTNTDLVFKVQVGAYKYKMSTEVSNQLLDIAEGYGLEHSVNTDNGLTEYTSGKFKDYSSANKLKNTFITKGVKGPFIVVSYKGKKISITQANDLLSGNITGEDILALTAEKKNTTNIVTNIKTNIDTSEVVFKIQVGAYKNEVPVEVVNKFVSIIPEYKIDFFLDNDGLTIYAVGKFKNYNSANEVKNNIVNKGLIDVFIIALQRGQKISVAKAIELLK